MIIVTHDMSEALKLADRLGVIDEGRLIACDRPEGIVKSSDPRVGRLLDAVDHAAAGVGSEIHNLQFTIYKAWTIPRCQQDHLSIVNRDIVNWVSSWACSDSG